MRTSASPFTLTLVNPFGIARSTRSEHTTIIVQVGEGVGEASPSSYYGESPESVCQMVEQIPDEMDSVEPYAVDAIMSRLAAQFPGHGSARAAVDIALHDHIGKKLGLPLYSYFGILPPEKKQTSFTIGIESRERMLQKVEEAKEHAILKIKLGRDSAHDMDVMAAIRKKTDKPLRVDANGGWKFDEAVRCVNKLADLGVEFVEQPLERGHIEETARLQKESPLPIFVDEDCLTSADIPKLVGKVAGINIKLMKCGGLNEARKMIAIARAFDLKIMFGCMIESSVAITAAAHLSGLCDYLDLDGALLVGNDPYEGMTLVNNYITLPDRPGLGVRPRKRK